MRNSTVVTFCVTQTQHARSLASRADSAILTNLPRKLVPSVRFLKDQRARRENARDRLVKVQAPADELKLLTRFELRSDRENATRRLKEIPLAWHLIARLLKLFIAKIFSSSYICNYTFLLCSSFYIFYTDKSTRFVKCSASKFFLTVLMFNFSSFSLECVHSYSLRCKIESANRMRNVAELRLFGVHTRVSANDWKILLSARR